LLSENIDKFAAGFLLLGFINAFNFMDGIDGITASETIHICASLLFLAILPSELQILLIVIIAATIGFGIWNWHPAKIFMGDVGSIPLGFILGWSLLYIATREYFIEAMIIPAYYLADTGITLLKRLVQGKKIWQAHSEHFYQQAVRAGRSHSHVVKMVIANNLLLMILTYFSLDYPEIALSLAITSTLGLLVLFKRKIKTTF
jgi:UDP-N-acetylmuramyl pentapeptide phosphotransferase/UDP-N-acetylglucosamine-1-phosphate transferase